jgi:hypothetical protein
MSKAGNVYHVILSAAKDLCSPAMRASRPQILRCAQDDRSKVVARRATIADFDYEKS